jgi:hypothetical protein
MHRDLHRVPPAEETRAGDPVPGNLVPCLIHRGHDGVRFVSSPDEESEPALIGERDTRPGPEREMLAARVQDGRSRLIGQLPEGPLPAAPVLREVPLPVPGAADGDLGEPRRR